MDIFEYAQLPDPTPDPDGGWNRTVDQLSTMLSLGVVGRLEEFGFLLHPTDIIPSLAHWLNNAAARAGYADADEFTSKLGDLSVLVEQISSALLTVLAEERPGTNPWEHPATIPIPAVAVHMITTAATLVVELAAANGKLSYAAEVLNSMGRMHDVLSGQLLREDADLATLSILLRARSVEVHGVIVRLPQPGIAHLARMFESAAHRLRTGALLTLGDTDDGADLAGTLISHAAMLRDLNSRFGKSTGPRSGS